MESKPAHNSLSYWLPPLLWMGFIASTSTDAFSAEHTGHILEWMLAAISLKLAPESFAALHFLIRKSAHFVEYVLLSFLWYRACQGGRRPWRGTSALVAVLVCLTIASLDEWHQTFLPSRTGAFRDVLLDLSGALFLQLMIAWRTVRRQRAA